MSAPLNDRPTPIREAFRSVGAAIAVAGTLINALVSLGVITAAQGTAVQDFALALPAVFELGVIALVAFGVIRRAEPQVTPIEDPAVEIVNPVTGDVDLVRLEIPSGV